MPILSLDFFHGALLQRGEEYTYYNFESALYHVFVDSSKIYEFLTVSFNTYNAIYFKSNSDRKEQMQNFLKNIDRMRINSVSLKITFNQPRDVFRMAVELVSNFNVFDYCDVNTGDGIHYISGTPDKQTVIIHLPEVAKDLSVLTQNGVACHIYPIDNAENKQVTIDDLSIDIDYTPIYLATFKYGDIILERKFVDSGTSAEFTGTYPESPKLPEYERKNIWTPKITESDIDVEYNLSFDFKQKAKAQKYLYDAQITDSLPCILCQQDSVKAISYATHEMMKSILNIADNITILPRIDFLTEKNLDMLGVDFHVVQYAQMLPLETKRALVFKALQYWSQAGTVESTEDVIQQIFGNGTVEEWFEYGGPPGYFNVITRNTEMTDTDVLKFIDSVYAVKRFSAWLDKIIMKLKTEDFEQYVGFFVHEATVETFEMEE